MDRLSRAVSVYAMRGESSMGVEKEVLRSNGRFCMARAQGLERYRVLTEA